MTPVYDGADEARSPTEFRRALDAYESALRGERSVESEPLLDQVCVTARHGAIPPEQLLVELKAMIDRAVGDRSLDERESVRRGVIGKAIEKYYDMSP